MYSIDHISSIIYRREGRERPAHALIGGHRCAHELHAVDVAHLIGGREGGSWRVAHRTQHGIWVYDIARSEV